MMVKKKDDSWRIYVAYLLSLSRMTLNIWSSKLGCIGGRRTSKTHWNYFWHSRPATDTTLESYASFTSSLPSFPLEDKSEFRAGGDDTIYIIFGRKRSGQIYKFNFFIVPFILSSFILNKYYYYNYYFRTLASPYK